MKPVNHSGEISEIFTGSKNGSSIDVSSTPSKLPETNFSWFIIDFILIIFCKPSGLRCFFSYNSAITSLNNKKFLLFIVKRGYLTKWGIIKSCKALIEFTA